MLALQNVRFASKKAGGGSANKNPKRARGQGYGILQWEGAHVFEGDYLVKQNRLRYHPGMNVSNEKNVNVKQTHFIFCSSLWKYVEHSKIQFNI